MAGKTIKDLDSIGQDEHLDVDDYLIVSTNGQNANTVKSTIREVSQAYFNTFFNNSGPLNLDDCPYLDFTSASGFSISADNRGMTPLTLQDYVIPTFEAQNGHPSSNDHTGVHVFARCYDENGNIVDCDTVGGTPNPKAKKTRNLLSITGAVNKISENVTINNHGYLLSRLKNGEDTSDTEVQEFNINKFHNTYSNGIITKSQPKIGTFFEHCELISYPKFRANGSLTTPTFCLGDFHIAEQTENRTTVKIDAMVGNHHFYDYMITSPYNSNDVHGFWILSDILGWYWTSPIVFPFVYLTSSLSDSDQEIGWCRFQLLDVYGNTTNNWTVQIANNPMPSINSRINQYSFIDTVSKPHSLSPNLLIYNQDTSDGVLKGMINTASDLEPLSDGTSTSRWINRDSFYKLNISSDQLNLTSSLSSSWTPAANGFYPPMPSHVAFTDGSLSQKAIMNGTSIPGCKKLDPLLISSTSACPDRASSNKEFSNGSLDWAEFKSYAITNSKESKFLYKSFIGDYHNKPLMKSLYKLIN